MKCRNYKQEWWKINFEFAGAGLGAVRPETHPDPISSVSMQNISPRESEESLVY